MADDISVLDAAGATQTVRAYEFGAKKHQVVVLPGEYEEIAVSTTATLGATGGVGDYLVAVHCTPLTTSPGAIQIKDGSNSAITVFPGGAASVSNLVPFRIELGIRSAQGAWQVITGANITAIGIGEFI